MEEADQLQKLEEEQEMLNSSLMALTSHFAQVQFRLKQIVDAEPEDKEVICNQEYITHWWLWFFEKALITEEKEVCQTE